MSNRPKTALVTGTTSGIGHELTNLFAKDGTNLILVSSGIKGCFQTQAATSGP